MSSPLIFTRSKSAIETLKKGVKYVQSYPKKHQNEVEKWPNIH